MTNKIVKREPTNPITKMQQKTKEQFQQLGIVMIKRVTDWYRRREVRRDG